jgi:hypothetical protein
MILLARVCCRIGGGAAVLGLKEVGKAVSRIFQL